MEKEPNTKIKQIPIANKMPNINSFNSRTFKTQFNVIELFMTAAGCFMFGFFFGRILAKE